MAPKPEKMDAICRGAATCLRALAAAVRRGNASRIVVKSETEIVADVPVTVGVLSAITAPWLTLLAIVPLLASTWTVEVRRPGVPRREPAAP